MNFLTGAIPTEIGLISGLGEWRFVMRTWYSVLVLNDFVTILFAVDVDLSQNNYGGAIPSEVGLLTDLSKHVDKFSLHSRKT